MSFFPAMFFPCHHFSIRPSLLSEVAAFGAHCLRRFVILEEQKMMLRVGTTALSSCDMDGFFSSRNCDISQTLLGISITFPFCRVRFIRVQTQKKGSRNMVNTHLRITFFAFFSCSQMHVVLYRSVVHGLGFLIC